MLARGRVEWIPYFRSTFALRPLLKAKGLANFKLGFVHVGFNKKNKESWFFGSSFASSSRDWRSSWVVASWVKMYFNLSQLYSFYMCEKFNFGPKSMWDKTIVLLGTSCGKVTHWELVKTLWEHDGNNQKKKLKKIKWALLSVC